MTIHIHEGGLDRPDVQALLRFHYGEAHRHDPSEFTHALPPAALSDPAISFFAAREGESLLGVAALKRLDQWHGEVKSMRTAPAALRRGVARLLLGHLLAVARARGLRQVSLETGTSPEFAAANGWYEASGFTDGPVFGGYPPSPFNRFMTLALT